MTEATPTSKTPLPASTKKIIAGIAAVATILVGGYVLLTTGSGGSVGQGTSAPPPAGQAVPVVTETSEPNGAGVESTPRDANGCETTLMHSWGGALNKVELEAALAEARLHVGKNPVEIAVQGCSAGDAELARIAEVEQVGTVYMVNTNLRSLAALSGSNIAHLTLVGARSADLSTIPKDHPLRALDLGLAPWLGNLDALIGTQVESVSAEGTSEEPIDVQKLAAAGSTCVVGDMLIFTDEPQQESNMRICTALPSRP